MGSEGSPRPERTRRNDYEYRNRDHESRTPHRDYDDFTKKSERSGPEDVEGRKHRRSRSPRSPNSRRRSSRSRERETHRNRDRRREKDESLQSHRLPDQGRSDRRGDTRRGDGRRGEDRQRRRDGDRKDDEEGRRGKEMVKRSGPLPSQDSAFAIENGEEPPTEKEKPNFGISGALAAASNSIAQDDGTTIVLKYHEPPEARKPPAKDQWKLFVFKGQDIIDTIELNARTCWLVGREMAVIDIAAEHPSISKQHAVIQFRYLEKRNEYGDRIGKVKPYLIDLESANGTMLNSNKVPDSRYLELKDKDLLQFGQSTREYVIMLAPKDR